MNNNKTRISMTIHKKTVKKKLPEFEEFLRANQRLPRIDVKDITEKSLARWMYKHKNWTPVLIASLPYKRVTTRLQELIEFTKSSGRLPHCYSENSQERSLATWTSRNRSLESVRQIINQYRRHKSVQERSIEFLEFLGSHERPPRVSSEDPTEKSLATWINSNRKLSVVIENLGQTKSYKHKAQRLEDLKEWVKTHPGKLPNRRSTDSIEKSLGQWRAAYRKWKPLIEFMRENGYEV